MFQLQGHSSLFQHLEAINQVRQSFGNAKDGSIMSHIYLPLPCHKPANLAQSKIIMLLVCYCTSSCALHAQIRESYQCFCRSCWWKKGGSVNSKVSCLNLHPVVHLVAPCKDSM